MPNAFRSVATRLAAGYGVLVSLSIVMVSAVFYFGTIGVLNTNIDGMITKISDHLVARYAQQPVDDLAREIDRELSDGFNSDTEVFLIVSPRGKRIVGNLTRWPRGDIPLNRPITRDVVRAGQRTRARLLVRRLPDGSLLYVGRDQQDQDAIRNLVERALTAGAAIAGVLVIAGALLFRRQIDSRIGRIRRTALEIGAGDLSRRIPIAGRDEFGRLSMDINRMLDRIEHLMEGVRHVSNAIAHDLRTPLSRIRGRLDDAVRHEASAAALSAAATAAIEDIDVLIQLFEKLLQIAEAESGVRTEAFEAVDLNRIAEDMVELYDAAAEECQVVLIADGGQPVYTMGVHNLLASAVASLIDNAVKYAGRGATVEVTAATEARGVCIVVRDNGPGIPAEELPKVTERFYRLDRSRSLPGNGLGLSIVRAIATMHNGSLELEDARPGLIARIILPAYAAAPHLPAAAESAA